MMFQYLIKLIVVNDLNDKNTIPENIVGLLALRVIRKNRISLKFSVNRSGIKCLNYDMLCKYT